MNPTGSDPARLTTLVWQPDGGAAALRPDGLELVTGGNDGALALWNVSAGRLVRTWEAHRGWVWASRNHPLRNVIVSTGTDGMAKVWDVATAESFVIRRRSRVVRR